jgi:hypothetical protein
LTCFFGQVKFVLGKGDWLYFCFKIFCLSGLPGLYWKSALWERIPDNPAALQNKIGGSTLKLSTDRIT